MSNNIIRIERAREDWPSGKWLRWVVSVASLLAASIGTRAVAQNYSIDWFKIADGGGTSTNGQYSLSATIGQHDAGGPLNGGSYSVTGGFWALYAAQAPGAPLLRIQPTNNAVMVYWPSPSTGWNLQVKTNLASSTWAAPSQPVTDNGTIKYIIVNPPVGKGFYRLQGP